MGRGVSVGEKALTYAADRFYGDKYAFCELIVFQPIAQLLTIKRSSTATDIPNHFANLVSL